MLIGNHPDELLCEINGEQLEKVENFQYPEEQSTTQSTTWKLLAS